MMLDPDALSYTAPVLSPIRHWLVGNVHGADLAKGVLSAGANVLSPYHPPGPPPGTGFHRCRVVFEEQCVKRKTFESTSGAVCDRAANFGPPLVSPFYPLSATDVSYSMMGDTPGTGNLYSCSQNRRCGLTLLARALRCGTTPRSLSSTTSARKWRPITSWPRIEAGAADARAACSVQRARVTAQALVNHEVHMTCRVGGAGCHLVRTCYVFCVTVAFAICIYVPS